MHGKRIAVIVTVTCCLISLGYVVSAQVTKIPSTVDEDQSLPSPEETRVMMQAKLQHSHRILEGLVSHDFKVIEAGASGLSQISLSPPPDIGRAGDKSDREIYEHFRMEFARLSGQLERHARRRELEATAYVQQNLTATCIACHEYIRDAP